MRATVFALLFMAGLGTACGGGSETPAATGSAAPAAAPAAATTATTAAASPAIEYKTVADVFPDAPEKAMVMNNCASCHNVACSVIGARTQDRWNSLRDAHRERVSGADVDAIFKYLSANFGDSKPEPKIPPAFLEGGCTPF